MIVLDKMGFLYFIWRYTRKYCKIEESQQQGFVNRRCNDI